MEERKQSSKLSKATLEMKFMKKTKERFEKDADDAEGQAMYSCQITDEMKKSGIVFVPTSIRNCKGLIDGRLSFGGMNPEIENLMSKEYDKRMGEIEMAKEKDVTDAEMAEGYSTLVGTIEKRFKEKSKGKGKFIRLDEEYRPHERRYHQITNTIRYD